jgi:hypothetical protein
MAQYLYVCQNLMKNFQVCEVLYVSRSQNKKANALSKLASCFTDPSTKVSIEELAQPAINMTGTCVIQQVVTT